MSGAAALEGAPGEAPVRLGRWLGEAFVNLKELLHTAVRTAGRAHPPVLPGTATRTPSCAPTVAFATDPEQSFDPCPLGDQAPWLTSPDAPGINRPAGADEGVHRDLLPIFDEDDELVGHLAVTVRATQLLLAAMHRRERSHCVTG